MAMETKRRDGRASNGPVSHARRPVNALDAAKRAAHAKPAERERLRAAAAGTRRAVSNGTVDRQAVLFRSRRRWWESDWRLLLYI